MESLLSGRTYLVSGATSGIGLAVATELARRGANVIGVGRSPERCAAAEERINTLARGGWVWFCVADLSLQAEVRKLASAVSERVTVLDGLVNNAGVFTYQQTITVEGFEMQWAVNHLAPFLQTRLLLPLLQAASTARVVTVSSGSHYKTRLRWDDLQLRRGYNGLLAYKQTKLCNVFFTAELNRKLGPDSTVHAFAADPGLVFTEMGFKGNPWLVRWIWARRRTGGISAQESARGVVFLATDPSIQNSAEIYWKHGIVKPPNPYALDAEAAFRLWEISTRMCGLSD